MVKENVKFYVITAIVVFIAVIIGMFVASKLMTVPSLSPTSTASSDPGDLPSTTTTGTFRISPEKPATFSADENGNLRVSMPGTEDVIFSSGGYFNVRIVHTGHNEWMAQWW